METKLKLQVRLTGLWRHKRKRGEPFFAGSLNPGVRLFVFKSSFEKGERDPDSILRLASSGEVPAAQAPGDKPELRDEDVPF